MAPRIPLFIFLSTFWASFASAFVFTNSFDGWVGNSTYTLTWDASSSDPKDYDLTLARPYLVKDAGVEVNSSWPMDWSTTVATHVHLSTYYLVMQSDKNTPLTPTFLIASSEGSNDLPTIRPSTTMTTTSFIPVTATQNVIATSNGQLVTLRPSDIFSSAVVYTTVVVSNSGGKGTPPGKIHMIVGVSLGALFLLTLPVIVWLILRYRRRPILLSSVEKSSDKHSGPLNGENVAYPSTVDLLESGAAPGNSPITSSPTSPGSTHQVWVVVNGEKRQMTVPRYPARPTPPANYTDPFADPVRPAASLLQSLPRLAIPGNAPQLVGSSPSASPEGGHSSRGNSAMLHSNSSPTYARQEPSEGTRSTPALSARHLEEKIARVRRQAPAPSPRTLSPDEAAARIFVPGRAVDMGPVVRARAGNVDENGLLPPDYSQATQPISLSNIS
ncbi:hypothetical protein BDV93DRAFT_511731 [Ceratobasidium sp. AG-I]|nr:hypothetical protein BDV93DRAFT_511731 [Ceratobasidium sp. AG-I]